MKKIYLLASALSVGLFASAQSLPTSFEDYSEATINGQSGWIMMAQTQTALINPLPTEIADLAIITSNEASNGNNSLKLSADDGSMADADAAAYAVFKQFSLPSQTGKVTLSFDAYIANGTGGQIQVGFTHYNGTTEVDQGGFLIAENQGYGVAGAMDPNAAPTDPVSVGEVGFDQWVTYSITFDLDDNKAEHFINGVSVDEFTTTNAPNIITIFKVGKTMDFYIDNIVVTSEGSSSIAINEKDVKVFPNPANDFVTFQIDGLENGNVVISSITGQEVVNTSLNGVTKVDVSALNNGVYIYKISNSNGELVKTSKLVIQK